IADYKPEFKYDSRFTTIFPRMWSGSSDHVKEYKDWGKIKGKKVKVTNSEGKVEFQIVPTFGENLRFFFVYQIGHMYLRYFMWNFSGKQNDTQSHGELLQGNWISGIKFIDEKRLGSQENLPGYLKNDPSRNKYYLLPLLLGLIGFFYQYQKNQKDFLVVLLLFILTGIAIVVYLNQYPLQPRERDYAYAGSFYAFAIWIGLGVLAINELIRKKLPNIVSPILATTLCFVLVPFIMAKENWDDHDRSERYTARDFAYNYLNSCQPNAILFTNGDNDTFPLWYAQEVEGIRTDVRIVNLSLFNTDWYIDQMARKAYDGEAVPFTLPREKYIQGTNDIIFYNDVINDFVDIDKVIEFVKSDDPRTKVMSSANEKLDYIPTSKFRLPVNKNIVLENELVNPNDADKILPSIEWTYKKRYLEKKSLMMLDFLATNNWERPVYYVSPGYDITLGLDDYLQLEGMAYKLVPIKTPRKDFLSIGRIDPEVLYNNLMNKFKWGRMYEPDVLIEFYNKRTISIIRIRNTYKRLADELVQIGKTDSAIAVMDEIMKITPDEKFPYDFYILGIVESYYNAGAIEKANELAKNFAVINNEKLDYFLSLKPKFKKLIDTEIQITLQLMQNLYQITNSRKQTELSKEIQDKFTEYYQQYSSGI
ncbi:MAG: DUF2723 domain-containing protein, partial [Bacteroidales bacterium]|nr:DUF2723 domain-containing protein [Bacteroidales bacterium]